MGLAHLMFFLWAMTHILLSERYATHSLHSIPHHQVHRQHPSSLTFPVPRPSSFRLFPKSHHHLRVLSASPGSPNYRLEESRWLREEQWWLCEEQRQFHKGQRWAHEESLLSEIAKLKLRIQALKCVLGACIGRID
ncbi:hypothetical protein NL676_015531 [Syzygium grande]|nr:hypothetical protein NL676_015531 [Syzygium grande]